MASKNVLTLHSFWSYFKYLGVMNDENLKLGSQAKFIQRKIP